MFWCREFLGSRSTGERGSGASGVAGAYEYVTLEYALTATPEERVMARESIGEGENPNGNAITHSMSGEE